ncbi:UNVERIFIED_CONTAM: Heavy metal-associated isoprenylated plant protein 36 [Sesamum calycinum]|uniref:Heavy metal-associated isoprenylated plant protein 36 n=1 Tax=Sesamum calycinum TaxID=2727403 RepID=A0AAW2PN16_9LAMI
MAETADEPEPVKTCVLKASIHCEGCKRKVKKILSQVQGVEFVDVDTKQQKVTVTGSVDADTLVKKLVKAGKKAQLWPQKPEKRLLLKNPNQQKKTNCLLKRLKEVLKRLKMAAQPKAMKKLAAAPKVVKDASVETGSAVQETKAEEKKTEEGRSAGGELPQAEEQKEAAEKSNGGTSGKKKKKRGQSGSAQSSAAGLENQEAGPPPPTNHGPPRHHHYPPPPPQYYYTPPPQPVPVVSYNTAYPLSSYTASYYAAPPPPYSYAYMHPGPETQPPPPDLDSHPRQPLDSFEIFSDENPNGCFIM